MNFACSNRIKAVLCIVLLAGAEVRQVQQNVTRSGGLIQSSSAPTNRASGTSSNGGSLSELELDSTVADPNVEEQWKRFNKAFDAAISNASYQMKDMEADVDFQRQVNYLATKMEVLASRIVEQMKTKMADPKFQEQATLGANQEKAMMDDVHPQKEAKAFAGQMEATFLSPRVQAQLKLLAENFKEQATHVAKHMETMMSDVSFRKKAASIAQQMSSQINDPNIQASMDLEPVEQMHTKVTGLKRTSDFFKRVHALSFLCHGDLESTSIGKARGHTTSGDNGDGEVKKATTSADWSRLEEGMLGVVSRISRVPLSKKGSLPRAPPPKQRRKQPFCGFGFLPLWSECVPLTGEDKLEGSPDWGGIGVNIVAGVIMGIREALGAIVSASMLFSSSDVPEISSMLQFGISMMLYTITFGVIWYAIFGRLQYAFGTQQDIICILQSQLAVRAAQLLSDTPGKIPATVFAIICLSSVLTGLVSLIIGYLSWASVMLMIPKPVVNGFLGAIGVVVLQAGLKTASGVKFHHFWPDIGLKKFCSSTDRVSQVACMLGHFICIRQGPDFLHWLLCTKHHPARKEPVKKYGTLVFQLMPLVVFYLVKIALGFPMEELEKHGWTYPNGGNLGPLGLWTTYKFWDVDVSTVLNVVFSEAILALIGMAILCTMLGALAINGRFNSGPDGDPAPDEPLDFNAELRTVGAASLVLGLSGGNLIFHKFSAIQLREDGGTHRIALLMIALVSASLFFFGFPMGSYVPKWFLGGLFLNTGWSFLKKTLMSFKSLRWVKWRKMRFISLQYFISFFSVLTALLYSPITAILVGMICSIILFVIDGMMASPVSNVVSGKTVVSRTKHPWWEMQVLSQEGDRICLIYLQGYLFFGSTLRLSSYLEAAEASDRIEFMILSFARVSMIDPSVAENLKTELEKMRKHHRHLFFCRMNEQVRDTLAAVGLFSDSASSDTSSGTRSYEANAASSSTRYPDEFHHETDALDFCNKHLIEKYCYGNHVRPLKATFSASMRASFSASLLRRTHQPGDGGGGIELEPYMLEYGALIDEGMRLPGSIFEVMNDLPPGTMDRIRPHCEIRDAEPAGSILNELPQMERALYFIFKGSVSLIRMKPDVDESNPLHLTKATFATRMGKHLLTRYPPGHVAGSDTFFQYKLQNPDTNLTVEVSSRFNPPAEIWILRYETYNGIVGWSDMDDKLKGYLARMLCVHVVDALHHSNMKER